MPWYYAGPEAKPVGPVSAEQLQALRAAGTITPDTFVIEHTGPGAANLAWRRYGELFPATPLPPLPPTPSAPPAPVPAPAPHPTALPPTSPAPAPHPLFPSAGAPPAAHSAPYAPAAQPVYAPVKPTNSWCAWGFALSIIGFFFAFACGIGLPALLAGGILCLIGLVQLSRNPNQGGHGLALFGLIFAGVGLLVAMAFLVWLGGPILKAHGLTVTEQTSNDSE